MSRFVMLIDTKKCVSCMDCVIACKTENKVPEGYDRDWLTNELTGKFPNVFMEIRSERCNHCDNPPCVYCCPTGASHIHEFGGIVLIDHDLCIGCKACLSSCPYEARYVHPDGYADKCTFCIHRVEKNMNPACVEVCPTHCMYFGDINDPYSEVSKIFNSRKSHALISEAGTKPKIYYLI